MLIIVIVFVPPPPYCVTPSSPTTSPLPNLALISLMEVDRKVLRYRFVRALSDRSLQNK